MKKSIKFVVILTASIAVVISLYLIKKEKVYKRHPIRPVDFPEILIAPEWAVSLNHSTPSNTRRVPDTYGLNFIVHDPFPSEDTRNFIKEHLSSKGWLRLNYHLQNPQVPLSLGPLGLKWPKRKGENKEWPIYWMEDWLSKDDESIKVICAYGRLNKNEPNSFELDLNILNVNFAYFGRESWMSGVISKYKELHPEEFDESNDANEPHSD